MWKRWQLRPSRKIKIRVSIVQTMSEPKINQQVLTLAAQQHYSNLNNASCFGHFNEKGGIRISIASPVGEEWNTKFPQQFFFGVQQNKLILLYQKKNLNIFKGWSFVIFTVVFWHIYRYLLKYTHNMMLIGSGNVFLRHFGTSRWDCWSLATRLQWETSNAHQQRWCSFLCIPLVMTFNHHLGRVGF